MTAQYFVTGLLRDCLTGEVRVLIRRRDGCGRELLVFTALPEGFR